MIGAHVQEHNLYSISYDHFIAISTVLNVDSYTYERTMKSVNEGTVKPDAQEIRKEGEEGRQEA